MRTSITLWLVVAATVVGGLFGSLLDRALVATEAWRHLGVHAWADYSRHADLGPGDIVYPIGGILWWALIFAAAVAQSLDRSASTQGRTAHLPGCAVFDRCHHRHDHRRPHHAKRRFRRKRHVALQSAFNRFTLWGVYIRGVLFALTFLCTVWALTVTSRHAVGARSGAINQGLSDAASS